ncbi:transcriptional regulator [Nocardiopsis salina]|uniref:transcriptional regulator n=1 Tax=Nocardiopsis salina TaxID=245836 RepID=UPI00034AE80D|nr:transcriptional regulator [Nocardiopsis salina]
MLTPSEELAEMDRLIHEPARLALTTALMADADADFVFLQTLTGLTKGNLSSHLHKLEQAGVVTLTKTGAGRAARTWVSLTSQGHEAVRGHWQRLEGLRNLAEGGLDARDPGPSG